jgi:hypothetical protein
MADEQAPEEITIQLWWNSGGGMSVRRDCLDPDHPEHTYNYILREFGVRPEQYGIEKPKNYMETCPSCGCRF